MRLHVCHALFLIILNYKYINFLINMNQYIYYKYVVHTLFKQYKIVYLTLNTLKIYLKWMTHCLDRTRKVKPLSLPLDSPRFRVIFYQKKLLSSQNVQYELIYLFIIIIYAEKQINLGVLFYQQVDNMLS